MKKLLITICILPFFYSAFALNVIEDTGRTIPIAPYVAKVNLPNNNEIQENQENQIDQENPKTQNNVFWAVKDQKSLLEQEQQAKKDNAQNLIFPVTSDFTVGVVKKHKLKITQHLPNKSVFLIGDDQESIAWAKANKEYLKKISAIGVITNVATFKKVKEIEANIELMLIPANVEGLAQITGSKNYPFLIYKGWVLQ